MCSAESSSSQSSLARPSLQSQDDVEMCYRLLADSISDVIVCHTATGQLSYVSPASQILLGCSGEDMLGGNLVDWLIPADRSLLNQALSHLAATGQPQTISCCMLHRDGSDRWVEIVSRLVDQSAGLGEAAQQLSVLRDITPRKQAEQALKAREDFLRLVLDSVPQPIFWKDRQSRYLGCNQAFAKAMGLSSPAAIIGRRDVDLADISAEDAAYYTTLDQLIMRHGEAVLHIIEPQSYFQGQGWIDCSRLPMRNPAGDVIGILCTFADITEQLAAQQALKTREHYLSTLSEIQRQLLVGQRNSTRLPTISMLAALGRVSGASRVYYYELYLESDGTALARQRLEWCAPGIPSTLADERFQAIPVDLVFAGWMTTLQQSQAVNLTQDQFTDLQWQLLTPPPTSVKSLLLLPLVIKGQVQGAMGFSNCLVARPWEQSEVDLLSVATADIALAIEQQQAEIALQQAEAKYRSIFENAVEGIFQTTLEGQYLTVNPMLARMYGYGSPAELIRGVTQIGQQLYVDPQRRQEFMDCIEAEGSLLGFESQVYRQDGSMIWISESARGLYDGAGRLIGYEGTVEDITERKRDEAAIWQRDQLLQGVAEASQYLLTATEVKAAIPLVLATLGMAAAADRVYVYEHHPHEPSGALAMSMRYEWVRPGIAPSITQPHWQNQTYSDLGVERWHEAFSRKQAIRGKLQDFPAVEQQLLAIDGILSILMVPVFIDSHLWGYIGFDACREERDWTANDESILVAIAVMLGGAINRQQTEDQMCYQAFHDSLTGLPNRAFFNQQLPLAIAKAQQTKKLLAVVFLDLDQFKTINDTLSHTVGDALLQQVTQRIAQLLRSQDIIARWGGDEFTLILSELTEASHAAGIARRIADSLKPPFSLQGHELHVTASMGIALFPHDGEDMATLLQNADAAMYRAKAQGRNNYQFYTEQLSAAAAHRLRLETCLHHALDRQEFVLHYQPQVNVVTGEIVQVESLLRWQHPQMGTVAPYEFIPLAEDNGLILPIGEWVIREACQQAKAWHQQGLPPVRVAVNLSARQLQHPDLVLFVSQVLAETGLAADYLELEITETAAMADIEASIRQLKELRQLGVHISMDDFGTGYSCLSYLKRFPLNGLKIDRTFVKDLPVCSEDQAMTKAIIAMAQGLNLKVIAEGVETREQMSQLQTFGCIEMQGYLFSRPLAVPAMTAYFHQGRFTFAD